MICMQDDKKKNTNPNQHLSRKPQNCLKKAAGD